MALQSREETSENFSDNVYKELEQISFNSVISDANFVINNVASLELPVDVEEKYGLRTCLVELERCDKIWDTIQLIRHLQDEPNVISYSEYNSIQSCDNIGEVNTSIDEAESSINHAESDSFSATNAMTPYIKYQPVLSNGNTALPNFQFSVQRTRVLYPCLMCGKQYSHTRSLKEHSERIHNIIIPSVRKKPENIFSDSKNNTLKSESNATENTKLSEDESTVSYNINQNSHNYPDNEELTDNPNNFHVNEKTFQDETRKFSCLFCNKSYKDKYTLNKHIKSIHGKHSGLTRAYNRKQSSKKSENTCKIRRIKQSRSLDVHRCKTCGKHFYSSRNIRIHSRKVHGIYVRKKPNSLSDHYKPQNVIKSNKNHAQAPLSAINKTDYELTKNNKSIKKYFKPVRKCPVCNKSYRDHLAWKNHCKREHEVTVKFISSFPTEFGHTSYTCNICKKKFYKVRDMIKHYKIVHRRVLRYKCETCRSLFYDIHRLINHSLTVHKTYLLLRRNPRAIEICNICGIPCTDQYDLEMHIKEHRKKTLSKKSQKQLEKKKKLQEKKKNTSITSNENNRSETRRSNYNKNKLFINHNNGDNVDPIVDKLFVKETKKETKTHTNNKHSKFIKNLKSYKNTSADVVDFTNCILCENRKFKHIRKHFMEYHKVRNPEAWIAQCSKTPVNDISPVQCNNKYSNTQYREQQNTNDYTNNFIDTELQQLHSQNKKYPGSERYFMKISRLHEKKLYVCKFCPFSSNNYDAMRADEKRHKREGLTLETKPLNDSPNNRINSLFVVNKKRKRESVDSRDSQRQRLSPSIDQVRNTRANAKIKEEYYHMCSLCSRRFRSSEILKSHKISCKARTNRLSTSETRDTRVSSDRDSAIGISITIKKKNDSYEIVSRDSNEEKSNASDSFHEKPNHIMSPNKCTIINIPKNIDKPLGECFEYSEHHEVIKIQKAEDFDVDIVSDVENQKSNHFHNQDTQPSVGTHANLCFELKNEKADNSDKLRQVLPLKTLC